MVFLTLVRLGRTPKPDKRWRKMELLRQSWSYFGRRRNNFRTTVRSVRKALATSTISRKVKKNYSRELWHLRLKAACEEHGMEKDDFMDTLAESNVALNRKVLGDMAIYEPRTFQSLVLFAKQRHEEVGLFEESGRPKPRIFARDFLRRF